MTEAQTRFQQATGLPPKPYNMYSRPYPVSEESLAKLMELAEWCGCSRSEMLRTVIRYAAANVGAAK